MDTFKNKQVTALPNHLRQYVVPQHYGHYTPVDQAVWRYVMRQNYRFLKDVAHYPYIPGLKKAGLTIERVPNLQEMNDALGEIGWGAVTVDGFIPPAAFMEFQAYRVLVIAADIRQINHIAYTPAPDIIHESAGHAPIIAEPAYAAYLTRIGEIGSKAIYSHKDFELYEAIRKLSILKESPDADPLELIEAEKELALTQANLGEPSEMALLSRLHWWTVEYGLIGTPSQSKIYGAGLLSSIGESASCLKDDVIKVPYSIDALNFAYDITQPQPQLFVTPDFETLISVLETFADTMAFRCGGKLGLERALQCGNTCTAQLSSGLQISGLFSDFELDEAGEPMLVHVKGPAALSYHNKQSPKQGKSDHPQGFFFPLGKVKGIDKSLEECSLQDLKSAGIKIGVQMRLEYTSGIVIEGLPLDLLYKDKKLLMITLLNFRMLDGKGALIRDASATPFCIPVGERVVSVFAGPADRSAFESVAHIPDTKTMRVQHDAATSALHALYKRVRNIRERGVGEDDLLEIWAFLDTEHPDDWLGPMEIYELVVQKDIYPETAAEIKHALELKAQANPDLRKLIKDGMDLIKAGWQLVDLGSKHSDSSSTKIPPALFPVQQGQLIGNNE